VTRTRWSLDTDRAVCCARLASLVQYFGFLFLLIGSIIGYRVWTGDHPKPYLLAGFSFLILLSGLLCFILEEDWFIHMSPTSKIPVYSLLGMSVCFALLFSLIDVINYCTTLCWPPEQTRPLINTEAQIYLVVATAVSMGLSFGFVFALFDVEDEKLSNIKMALMREERYDTIRRTHSKQ
jgi:hypothetical protein